MFVFDMSIKSSVGAVLATTGWISADVVFFYFVFLPPVLYDLLGGLLFFFTHYYNLFF